jgi:hypothetical protein
MRVLEFTQVEVKFLSFENDTISTTRLSRAGRQTSKDTSSNELINKRVFNGRVLFAAFEFAENVVGTLLVQLFLGGLGKGSVLLTGKGNTVVSLVPLTEWSSINLDNATFHKGVGTDQFVVGGIVDDTGNTGLASNSLGTP